MPFSTGTATQPQLSLIGWALILAIIVVMASTASFIRASHAGDHVVTDANGNRAKPVRAP